MVRTRTLGVADEAGGRKKRQPNLSFRLRSPPAPHAHLAVADGAPPLADRVPLQLHVRITQSGRPPGGAQDPARLDEATHSDDRHYCGVDRHRPFGAAAGVLVCGPVVAVAVAVPPPARGSTTGCPCKQRKPRRREDARGGIRHRAEAMEGGGFRCLGGLFLHGVWWNGRRGGNGGERRRGAHGARLWFQSCFGQGILRTRIHQHFVFTAGRREEVEIVSALRSCPPLPHTLPLLSRRSFQPARLPPIWILSFQPHPPRHRPSPPPPCP